MIFDLQKASMWKRISAWLFDMILLLILTVGACYGLSAILDYDGCSDTLNGYYEKYQKDFDISFEITQEQYDKMSEADRQKYADAQDALMADKDAMHAYSVIVHMTMLITALGILAAFLLLELVVPLLFKNGQTLGKKVFSICVMRKNGLKLNAVSLFIRTVLGKYTVETMLPMMVLILVFFGSLGIYGTMAVGVLLLVQVILLITTRTCSSIHDLLAGTVVVDYASQMIFDTPEEMLAYQQEVQAEQEARPEY